MIISFLFFTSKTSARPLIGSLLSLNTPSNSTYNLVFISLNSAITASGVPKSQRSELVIPYLEIGNAENNKTVKRMKIITSTFEPASGRKLGFLGITSRLLFGQNSWLPLGLNMSNTKCEKYPIANAASQRLHSEIGIAKLCLVRIHNNINMADKIRLVASQPITECVIVLCPNLRSNGFEMNGKSRPITDLGISISGNNEPKIAKTKMLQCKLCFTPKIANKIRVKKRPKIEWVGASILSHPKYKETNHNQYRCAYPCQNITFKTM